jgi:uncharacterized membrane protein YhaH (DUF805 family)
LDAAPAAASNWYVAPKTAAQDQAPAAPVAKPAAPAALPAMNVPLPLQPSGLADLAGAAPEAQAVDEVKCPNCGERQPMRVLCRHCATYLEVALGAQAEKEARAKAERVDAARARRGLGRSSGFGASGLSGPASGHGSGTASGFRASGHGTSQHVGRGADAPAAPLWGLGLQGRLGRLNYAIGTLSLWVVLLLAAMITLRMPKAVGAAINLLVTIPVILMSLRHSALRFHDRGHSGWWNLVWLAPAAAVVVGSIVPLMGVLMFLGAAVMTLAAIVYLLFIPGNDDDNAYGESPNEGQLPVFVVALAGVVGLASVAPNATMDELRKMAGAQSRDDAAASKKLGSREAVRAYSVAYRMAQQHKAFAASPDGTWGWKSDANTADEAMDGAMTNCERHRPAAHRPCELVSVDDKAVP